MSLFETKDWKLSGNIDWVPKRPDEKVSCWACRGRGVDIMFGETTCSECSGNGFKYTRHTTESKPEIPDGLIEHMRKAFKEYMENNK